MQAFIVIYLPTGRPVKTRDGADMVLRGTTERGAKAAYTRGGGYLDWNLHALRAQ